MSEYEDLNESTERAREPFDKKVAVTMAIIAAALAIVSVLGQIFATEELLAQQQSSDQWAFYQAKSIRRYESDIARDLFKVLQSKDSAAVAGTRVAQTGVSRSAEDDTPSVEKYAANIERYQKDGEEIQKEAQKLGDESKLKGREALRLHIGEVFLEIGIVFASLAILTKRWPVWMASIISACVGVGIAATAVFIR